MHAGWKLKPKGASGTKRSRQSRGPQPLWAAALEGAAAANAVSAKMMHLRTSP